MDWNYNAGETVLIIGAVSTGIGGIAGVFIGGAVKILAALREIRVAQELQKDMGTSIEKKVDTVHELTNSRLSRLEGELVMTRGELRSALTSLQAGEVARQNLANEASRIAERPYISTGTHPIPVIITSADGVPEPLPLNVFVQEPIRVVEGDDADQGSPPP